MIATYGVILTFEHYPRRIFHPTRPSAEPNEWELGGEYDQACVTPTRVCSHWLERKSVTEYGKTQIHKGYCGCRRHRLGESSDLTSRPRSSLDGKADLCHSNSRASK